MVLAPQSTDLPQLQLKPGRWTVGSAATCSYRIVGAGIQPRHALILCGGNAIVLKPWDARTWVNGEPVRGEVKLRGGDRITFGTVDFEIEASEAMSPLESQLIPPADVAPADVTPNVETQVTNALDQLTETINSSLQAIESESSTNVPDREELMTLRQRVRELEESSTTLSHELENSQQNLAVLEEELALQKQLAATIELVNEDHRALAKRADEIQIVRANQEREKKVLAHSWEWLQTDRRQLVVEKEEWQQQYNQMLQQSNAWTAERDQWLKERDEFTASTASLTASHAELIELQNAFQNDKAQWEQERQQVENEVRTVASDLDAARASVAAQQAEVASEWSRLQTAEKSLNAIRVELDQKIESLESVQTLLETQQQKLHTERQQLDAQKTEFGKQNGGASEPEAANGSDALPTKTTTVTRRVAIIHDDKDALLSTTSSGDSWSHGVDLTEHTRNEFASFPRPEPAVSLDRSDSEPDEFAEASNAEPSQPETATADPAAVKLRAELARMFNLRELQCANANRSDTSHEDWPDATKLTSSETTEIGHATANGQATANAGDIDDSSNSSGLPELDLEPQEDFEPQETVEQSTGSHKSFIREEPLNEGGESYGGVVMTTDKPAVLRGQVADDSLSFNNDEHVDESVDRYMQGLLARSRGWNEPADARLPINKTTPVVAPQKIVPETSEIPSLPAVSPTIDVQKTSSEDLSIALPLPTSDATISDIKLPESSKPVHQQDKDALRAVTENMREVANLQALKNVETADWVRLRSSIKIKSALAAFSFMLCLGLLYLGYQSNPKFIVLGSCAACIGTLTWVDLFMAIYKVRHRSKELDEQRRKRS